jgi:hypothetical protein
LRNGRSLNESDLSKEYDLSEYSLLISNKEGLTYIDLVPRILKDSTEPRSRSRLDDGQMLQLETDSCGEDIVLRIRDRLLSISKKVRKQRKRVAKV